MKDRLNNDVSVVCVYMYVYILVLFTYHIMKEKIGTLWASISIWIRAKENTAETVISASSYEQSPLWENTLRPKSNWSKSCYYVGWYLSSMLLHCLFMVFFYCLVSSENSLPNDASVVDGDLLKFAPCMPWGCWCATDGLCNWHSVQSQRGLLKSASSPFELFAVTGSIRETRPDQKNMPNHSILHPHDILSRVDGGAQLDLREKHSSSMRVCQTPADFPGKML